MRPNVFTTHPPMRTKPTPSAFIDLDTKSPKAQSNGGQVSLDVLRA